MNINLIGEPWFKRLESEFNQPYFIELKEKLRAEYKQFKILPAPDKIFEAFKLTPPDKVRVVFVGQDPYPFGNHSNGVAFSSYQKDTPASLQVLFRELDRDILKTKNYQEFKEVIPNNDLTPWCNEGVLLLNSVLTVRAESPASHAELGWQRFIQAVIENIHLYSHDNYITYVAFGKQAQAVLGKVVNQPEFYLRDKKPLVLYVGHPASGSHGKDTFSGSNPFSKINHYFYKNNQKEIEWKLLTTQKK